MYALIRYKLLPYILPYKSKVVVVVLLSFVLAALGGIQVALIKPIFDNGLSAATSLHDVYYLAGTLLLVGLLNFPCRFFHFYWMRYIVDQAICKMREEIFAHLQLLPVAYFNASKQGDLISHILNDTIVFAHGLRASIDLIREPLKAIVYMGMAFASDWQLTLVIFIIAPFLVGIFSISGRKIKQNQSMIQNALGLLTHNIAEGILSQKITKAFNLQRFVQNRFVKSQNDLFDSQMRTTKVEEMAHPLVELVGTIAFSLVIVFAHYRISSGATTVGEFVSFIAAMALFMDPIRKFSQANVKLSQSMAASTRIYNLLDTLPEVDQGTLNLTTLKDEISITNLSFSYGEGQVLNNISFTVKKGEKVALVGASGSGKSTLINLLLGLYPIAGDEIKIDGHSIKHISLRSLRSLFGLVSQDIFLFNDSVKQNLMVGNEFDATQINNALEVSYATEFINDLPAKEDTNIGDSGVRLSGGQKQRITIARAFLQNSDVYLFDEATSALDNESEKVVQKALEQIAGDKTVIAVAHRLSTIQDFDKIIVMKRGEIIEQGTHQELLALNGEYFRLHESSAKK